MSRRTKKRIALILIGVVVAFSAVSMFVIHDAYQSMFARVETPGYSLYLRYEDVAGEYERETFSFPAGENTLQGYLYGAENRKGLVVICHGIGGGAESYFPETVYFLEHGYQVFAFDNTGCYGSGGESMVGLNQSVLDLDAALTYLEGQPRFDGLPVLLYGHSWGGYAVTAIFNFDHEIAASVSVAGFSNPTEMIAEWFHDKIGWVANLEYPYISVYQWMIFGENRALNAVDGINRTNTPVLLIHGDADTTVDYDGAATVAHRDEITNPNVQYKICSVAPQNDHVRLSMSPDAIAYDAEVTEDLDALQEASDGAISSEEMENFLANVDKQRISQLDEEFMSDVLAFYEQAIRR